jgi:hypothetical protein
MTVIACMTPFLLRTRSKGLSGGLSPCMPCSGSLAMAMICGSWVHWVHDFRGLQADTLRVGGETFGGSPHALSAPPSIALQDGSGPTCPSMRAPQSFAASVQISEPSGASICHGGGVTG